MAKTINYGQLMQKALRRMLADVLTQVARDGLPGEHHFFITFETSHPGVDMSAALRARYPDEMTIVMQEWFEDLAVMKDRFSVTLSFGGVAEPIVIPFEAIKTFVDPSVEFGLRFDAHEGEAEEAGGARVPAKPEDETLPEPSTPETGVPARSSVSTSSASTERQYSPVSMRSVPSRSRSRPSSIWSATCGCESR